MASAQTDNILEIGLRQALNVDKVFTYQVKQQALGPYIQQVWGWNEDVQLEFHEKEFDPAQLQIITYGGRDIGMIEILSDAQRMLINKFYILPAFQGRGIGSKILTDATNHARQTGLFVRLGVLKINPAIHFYQRHGFQIIGETETHWKMEFNRSDSVLE